LAQAGGDGTGSPGAVSSVPATTDGAWPEASRPADVAGAAMVAAHPAASAFRGAFAAGAACALAAALIAVFLVPPVLRGADDGRPAH
jgi:hypothetical protein